MVEYLVQQYGLDLGHTRHVRMLACAIFDRVRRELGFPQRARTLLAYGALLHDVGVGVNEEQHHRVGRTMVLQTRFLGLDEDERAIVACLVAFHRKRVRPEVEPAYVRLGKKDQALALRLAALLRVADGLDYSHTQTTRIGDGILREQSEGKGTTPTMVLRVYGPFAEEDAAQAMRKADLWKSQFPFPLSIEVMDGKGMDGAGTDQPAPRVSMSMSYEGLWVEKPEPDGVEESTMAPLADAQSLAMVIRRMLYQHFQALLSCERDVRKDKDIEAVHDMRVATRRLRAIFPVLEAIVPRKLVRPFRRSVQQIARRLGAVRDIDVFLAHVATYCRQTQTPQDQLALLTDALRQDRLVGRNQLLLLLSSELYEQFTRQFAIFITDDAEQWEKHLRLRDLLGSRIWQRYEELRAYETVIDLAQLREPAQVHASNEAKLHEARIAGKRLRYLLEMVAEGQAGEWIQEVLQPLVNLQSCLGDLQDIAVARAYIGTLDTRGATPTMRQALDAYVAYRIAHRVELLNTFPVLWNTITAPTYQRQLMELIIAL